MVASDAARARSVEREGLKSEGPERRGRISPPFKLGFRIAVSVALLVFLITKIPADSVTPRNDHPGTIAFLALGLVMTALGFVLSAWRWQRVLVVFHTHVPLRTLLSHYLAGQFVGNVLPSTIGGDVLRISRAAKSTGTADIAFASVVIERLSGFIVLPALTFIGFAIMPSLLDVQHAWIAMGIAIASVVAFVAIVLVAAHPRLAGRFAERENWMRFVGAVHIGIDRIRREPRQALSVLAAAFVYQLSVVLSVWCAIHTLGVSVPNAAVLAYVPAVASGQVLPISLSGLGIREGLLVLLLHPLGVPTGRAIGVGLIWYGMMLAVSLFGAPAFAVGHRQSEPEPEPEPAPAP
ncbi:MAG: lysylphosphatidylglycerol synthase transmembrane domain-containing protein [Acidimicrobiia bacterium]